MATNLKTWTKELFNVTGSTLAGPAGALIGSLTGGLVSALLATTSDQYEAVFNRPLPDTPDNSVKALFEQRASLERSHSSSVRHRQFFKRQRSLSERSLPSERQRSVSEHRSPLERLDPIEKRHINHDLQTTFRDALREAIYDLGGERCFPQVWGERPRQVPGDLIFLATSQGDKLWQAQDPLAEQVCRFFMEMLNAVAEQRLLPLEPPLDRPAARVYPIYPEAEMPQSLTEAFFYQVILLPLHGFDTLLSALPDFEAGLRRNLIDRALIHLGGMLKTRMQAWSAYNRLALEALSGQIYHIDATQTDLLALLDGLMQPPEAEGNKSPAGGRTALAQWSTGLADLLSAMGRLEKQPDEGFEVVLARLEEQQDEAPVQLDLLLAAYGHLAEAEGAALTPGREHPEDIAPSDGRLLRFQEDGSFTVEGVPPVALDEPPAPGEPPYKGLRPFSAEDADLFFGREQITARLADRLRPAPSARKGLQAGGNFLALIGAAGCGKTSLVRAGLIPALQRGQPLADGTLPPAGSDRWPVYFITPGEHPLLAMAESLAREDHAITPETLAEVMQIDTQSLHRHLLKLRQGPRMAGEGEKHARGQKDRILIIVDQFEELFTQCAEQAERKAFVDNLLAAVEQTPPALVLVIVLRADFYARCADYENLRQAVASRQEYIGAMAALDLRRAIEEPARRGGWELEARLAKAILHDLDAVEPQWILPAVSHTLLETWKGRRGRMMTLESYAESGGAGAAHKTSGAIAKTAERVFQQFDADQQAIARYIFLQLARPTPSTGTTPPGEGTSAVCRRLRLAELAPTPEAAAATDAVLQSLADAGLITLSQGSAEIAHEALIHAWPALRTWLEEAATSQHIHRQLTTDAQEWRRLNNAPTAVYRGAQLASAQEWAEGHVDLLSLLEAEFLEFSKFVIEHEAAAQAARSDARRQREVEAARQPAKEARKAETKRIPDVERRQLVDQAARRQRLRSLIGAGMTALLVLAAILALVFAGISRQQQIRADHRAATALQSQATAQSGSTQAVAAQTTAQAQAQRRATAEAKALSQKSTAEAARDLAQHQELISVARELAAFSNSLTSQDVDLSLLLAAEAVYVSNDLGRTPVDEAQTALFHALQAANFSGVLRGHTGEVLSAVYSQDGKYALTTSKDGTALLWDLSSREAIIIRAYTGGITSAAFSPDGKRILTTGSDQDQDGVAELWELGGAQAATFAGHTGKLLGGCFNPDGTLIATAGQDKTARLWKIDGTPVAVLAGHTEAVTAVLFSRDGTRLLTLSADATARLWRTDGSSVATLSGHTGPVLGASFNTDSSRILTASADGTARIWLADGTPAGTLVGHTGEVYSAVFSSDAQRVLTASADGTARLWRADGNIMKVLTGPLAAAADGSPSSIYMATFNPEDSDLILTAGADATSRLWRADGTLITTLTGHTAAIYSARFSADGRQIVTASADGTARLWDINRLYASPLTQNELAVMWAGFSPDGKQVLAAGLDGVAHLFSLDGKEQVAFTGHTGGLVHASFSPDGQFVATASRDGNARIWRSDGTFLVELRGHTGPVRSVNFSPDSKQVVTASEDGTARLYRVSGSFVLALDGHEGEVWSASFSPDGSRIVTASQDGTTRIWGIDGQMLQTIDNNKVPVNMAAFSPDGQRVITAGQDDVARLWKTDGTPVASLEGHTDVVNWAAFSPDGKLIATASKDGSVRLWTMDGNFLAKVEGHTQGVTCASFSPDGIYLVTASRDGTARLWSIYENLNAMRVEAAQRVGRTLTQSECQRYLHTETCTPKK
jgi:WD40 repeat protein